MPCPGIEPRNSSNQIIRRLLPSRLSYGAITMTNIHTLYKSLTHTDRQTEKQAHRQTDKH